MKNLILAVLLALSPMAMAEIKDVPPLSASNSALATSLVVKASAGVLYSITGYNSKGSAQFIQLHDSATLPADTAVPELVITVPATSNFTIDFGVRGRYFFNGIVVSNSSTAATKTIGSADVFVDALYN